MENSKLQIQETSNPAILKFEANSFFDIDKSYEFNNIDDAKDSPLAQQLFYLPFVKTVFISGNFIAIERFDIVSWNDVQDEVAEQLENYLNSKKPIVIETHQPKKTPITVYAESTPNPAVMKFVANKKLVNSIFEFKNIDDAKNSPLAQKLFHFPFVKEVFMTENYISITKFESMDWNDITLELRDFITRYLADGNMVIAENAIEKSPENNQKLEKDRVVLDDTSKQIVDILDEYVKPAVASDGGNILFKSYDEASKTVHVILQGACSGCPSSTVTLKNGIETMLKNMLSDKVQEVVALNG